MQTYITRDTVAMFCNMHHATAKALLSGEEINKIVHFAKSVGMDTPKWAKKFSRRFMGATSARNEESFAAGNASNRAVREGEVAARNNSQREFFTPAAIFTPVTKTTKPVEQAVGTVIQRLVESVDHKWVDMFRPLLRGEGSAAWVDHLHSFTLTSKAGNEYSSLFGTTLHANAAVSMVNRRLFAGFLVDVISKEEFEATATEVVDRICHGSHAIAAARGIDASTHGSAIMEATIRVKDHGADGVESRIDQVREEIKALQAQGANVDPVEAGRLILELDELVADREMRDATSDYAHPYRSDARPNDTGELRGAIESFEALYALDPSEIKGMEAEMNRALWSAKGLALPTTGRDMLEQRLSEAWDSAIRNADTEEDKKDLIRRITKRGVFFDKGLAGSVLTVNRAGEEYMQSLASYARWAVNHFTRRLWRDEKMLNLALELYTSKREAIQARIVKEEEIVAGENTGDSGVTLTRVNAGEVQELGYTINLPILGEYGDHNLDPYASQGDRMISLYEQIMADIEAILPKVRATYAEYRKLDEAHLPLWQMLEGPAAPPVYWNMAGTYLTEEDAEAALMEEIKQRKDARQAKNREELIEVLDQMLGDFGPIA